MAKLLLILLLLLNSVQLLATTYFPISFTKQIRESSGVIQGRFVGLNYKKLPNDQIITEISFQIEKAAGISISQIVNPNDFKFHFPGGVWQGVVHHFPGMPSFEKDKIYMLLITQDGVGNALSGFSLGVYEYHQTHEQGEWYSSVLFPEHKELGHIDLAKLNTETNQEWGKSLVDVKQEKIVQKINQKIDNELGRSPASLEDVQAGSDNNMNIFLLFMLFTLLGTLTLFLAKRS